MAYLYAVSWTPPPGTIGLTYARGFTALRAALGQRLLTDSTTYNHAFITLDHGLAVEPWPSGARVVPLSDFDGDDVAYGWLPGLTGSQQRKIIASAVDLLDIGYGLLDYHTLARYRARAARDRVASDRVVRRLCRTDRLLPAQFVVEAYRGAGIYLFPDRIAGDATLDQLGALFIDPEEEWELRVPCTMYA